ncbi:hypothetical protein BD626DRAFT_492806 [Schizophyllum amplum]|uniref:Uncharacterized protein n=1 Tax=Schizophyllum amplum TaxID=97359 RepID=A0A550CGA0_9AGAR|nr:hypothetical protein BD626DRAFT_492806 [Auriculariopsis ampla]
MPSRRRGALRTSAAAATALLASEFFSFHFSRSARHYPWHQAAFDHPGASFDRSVARLRPRQPPLTSPVAFDLASRLRPRLNLWDLTPSQGAAFDLGSSWHLRPFSCGLQPLTPYIASDLSIHWLPSDRLTSSCESPINIVAPSCPFSRSPGHCRSALIYLAHLFLLTGSRHPQHNNLLASDLRFSPPTPAFGCRYSSRHWVQTSNIQLRHSDPRHPTSTWMCADFPLPQFAPSTRHPQHEEPCTATTVPSTRFPDNSLFSEYSGVS